MAVNSSRIDEDQKEVFKKDTPASSVPVFTGF